MMLLRSSLLLLLVFSATPSSCGELDDVQGALSETKNVIDTVEPYMDMMDAIPGMNVVSSIMKIGSNILGLFGKHQEKSEEQKLQERMDQVQKEQEHMEEEEKERTQKLLQQMAKEMQSIKDLRKDMDNQFARLNNKFDESIEAIKDLSNKLDGLFAKSEWDNMVGFPLLDLLTVQQTYFAGPSNVSRDRFLQTCRTHDPILIFPRIERILLDDNFLKNSMEQYAYEIETFRQLKQHILRHIKNAIFLNGMCVGLKSNGAKVPESEFKIGSTKAGSALDAFKEAERKFAVWVASNIIQPGLKKIYDRMWNDHSIQDLQKEQQTFVDKYQFSPEDILVLWMRNSPAVYYFGEAVSTYDETFNGNQYKAVAFTRYGNDECEALDVSDDDIPQEACNSDWGAVATEILKRQFSHQLCLQHSMGVFQIEDWSQIAHSPRFELRKRWDRVCGQGPFSLYIY